MHKTYLLTQVFVAGRSTRCTRGNSNIKSHKKGRFIPVPSAVFLPHLGRVAVQETSLNASGASIYAARAVFRVACTISQSTQSQDERRIMCNLSGLLTEHSGVPTNTCPKCYHDTLFHRSEGMARLADIAARDIAVPWHITSTRAAASTLRILCRRPGRWCASCLDEHGSNFLGFYFGSRGFRVSGKGSRADIAYPRGFCMFSGFSRCGETSVGTHSCCNALFHPRPQRHGVQPHSRVDDK